MTKVSWKGVFPALMTEMTRDGAIDLEATQRHVRSCLAAGCEGFIMLGTLGENCSLSRAEKLEVVAAARDAAGGKVPVLSGVAEYTTRDAASYAREVAEVGADGLMVLPSMVYQQDQREALAHFGTIARATDLPIMIYNNPVSYKLDVTDETFAELAQFDTIVSVKESSHDSRRITDMINRLGDRYVIFCGVDDLVLENLAFGASGWVAGLVNAFPKESVALYKLAKAGRLEEALAIYRWFMPLLHLDVDVKLVQMIKLANQMTGEGAEWVREPRLPLVGEERARVEAIVRRGIETRPKLPSV
ncbi:MAG: dihydrodipicolinate synthase family protein [Rhizobiales bacterium]|nr:dihydrodipicolinate synthase family protein [Hyphomicrobiales bacterium]